MNDRAPAMFGLVFQLVFFLVLVAIFSGCSTLASLAGASAPAIQAARLADAGKTAADVAAYAKEGRSFTDAVASRALERDCKLTRLLAGEGYCVDEQEDE